MSAVTGRSLLESPPTQARNLEGRPLGMASSLMLERSTLRLLEPGSRFASALGEQERPMTGLNELREQGKMPWIEPQHGWGRGAGGDRDAAATGGAHIIPQMRTTPAPDLRIAKLRHCWCRDLGASGFVDVPLPRTTR